jgi:superfamily II DNA helicase RecQ
MLGGSVAAPPSARRNDAFGVLEAARPGTIRRWVGRLVESGHLEQYESEDGYRLLRPGAADGPPPALDGAAASPGADVADDDPLFATLRAWRRETAQRAEVPAYVVLPDKALRALAATRPGSAEALLDVPGIGPTKLERYGTELLAVIGEYRG